MIDRRVVVVGASWGGMYAVGRLLGNLRPDSPLTILVAQHRAPDSPDQVLVRYLQARSPLPVREAEDKDEVEPAHVFVAPPDYHLLVEPGHLALSVDAPVMFSRPSIDVLFESAADSYGSATVAVVLTGANDDGSRGVCMVHERGGLTLVQDPLTAERREMPDAAIATGVVDQVLTVEQIASVLNEVGGGKA